MMMMMMKKTRTTPNLTLPHRTWISAYQLYSRHGLDRLNLEMGTSYKIRVVAKLFCSLAVNSIQFLKGPLSFEVSLLAEGIHEIDLSYVTLVQDRK